MYGYIYETTNLINGKKYIGQHRGSFDKEYKGSGTLLRRAIKKYGKENFEVKLLEECNNQIHLNEREIYWITKFNADLSNNYYNICKGGSNERTFRGKNNPMYGKTLSKEVKAHLSKVHKGLSHKVADTSKMKAAAQQRAKEIMKNKLAIIKGRICVNNGIKDKYINPSELDLYISKGYKKGSKNKGNKPPNTNKICVYYNNFKNRKYILKEELNMYLKKGFKLYSNRKDVN